MTRLAALGWLLALVLLCWAGCAKAVERPSMDALLYGVASVESSWRVHAPDGDLDKPICQRSVGMYQVRPIAVRELVRLGRLKLMVGFSLTNCSGIRAWLAVPANNRTAARLYLLLLLDRSGGDVEDALAAYNCGQRKEYPLTCRRYAGQVLALTSRED